MTGVGALANMFGANKQAKEDAAARELNYAAQQEAERQNWARYLMTRGIAPGADIQTGVVPGVASGSAINTKLPLWMNVMVPKYYGPNGEVQSIQPQANGAPVPFIRRKAA